MSSNTSERHFDINNNDIPQLASDVLREAASEAPRDARRMVEDKLEEIRLCRELTDYDYE